MLRVFVGGGLWGGRQGTELGRSSDFIPQLLNLHPSPTTTIVVYVVTVSIAILDDRDEEAEQQFGGEAAAPG
jgi:hypothetical protein